MKKETVRDLVLRVYPHLKNVNGDIKDILKCDPNLTVTPMKDGRFKTKIGILKREPDTSELGYSFE